MHFQKSSEGQVGNSQENRVRMVFQTCSHVTRSQQDEKSRQQQILKALHERPRTIEFYPVRRERVRSLKGYTIIGGITMV
jgi:hypothetical protein